MPAAVRPMIIAAVLGLVALACVLAVNFSDKPRARYPQPVGVTPYVEEPQRRRDATFSAVAKGDMLALLPLAVLSLAFASVAIGYQLGEERGRPGLGACLGLFFGPLGVIAAAAMPRTPLAEAIFRLQVERARPDAEFALFRAAAAAAADAAAAAAPQPRTAVVPSPAEQRAAFHAGVRSLDLDPPPGA